MVKLILVFADQPDQKYEFQINEGVATDWIKKTITLDSFFTGREIAVIGLGFQSIEAVPSYSFSVGNLKVYDEGAMGITQNLKNNSFITISYPNESNTLVLFNINWPNAKQLQYLVTDMQGKVVKENTISANTAYPFSTNGLASGTYIVKFTDQNQHIETRKIIIK